MSSEAPIVGLSTRDAAGRDAALLPAVEEILQLGQGILEIEAPMGADDLDIAARRIKEARARVVAVRAPLLSREENARQRRAPAFLSDPAEDDRLRAKDHLEESVQAAASLRCDLVLVSGGFCALSEAEDWQKARGGDSEEAVQEARRHWQRRREARREEAVEYLCRSFHELLNRHPGLRLALRIDAHAGALLGPEECRWILEDGDPRRIGLWYDGAACVRRESLGMESKAAWDSLRDRRAFGSYLSDADGLLVGLPLKAGTFDGLEDLAGVSPALPRILKLAPGSSRLLIAQSLEMALGAL